MPGKPSVGTHVSDSVVSRTALADALLTPEHAPRIDAVGLLRDDLQEVATTGHAAIQHDTAQQVEAADEDVARQQKRLARDDFDNMAEALRVRVPIAIHTLRKRPETEAAGRWLAGLAVEHFRLRVTTSATPAEGAAPPERVMVPRRDRLAYARAVGQLAGALLAPERAPVVEELARRGFDRPQIEQLALKAEGYVGTLGGKLTLRALEATRLEAEAVTEQKVAWEAVRRQVRRAVRGVPALEELYARC